MASCVRRAVGGVALAAGAARIAARRRRVLAEKSKPTDFVKNQNSFKNALPRATRPLAVQKPKHAKGSQGVRSTLSDIGTSL